jgi:hypothetical protein
MIFLSEIQHYPMYIMGAMDEKLSQQNLSNPADTANFIFLYPEL